MIHNAELADAAALAELAERTFRDAFGDLNRPEDMDLHCRSSFGEQLQASEIADPAWTTLLAWTDGRMIGFGQLCRGDAAPSVAAARPVEIRRLYVDRQWHGKGVAQALMTALLEAAAGGGADVVWLGVWERNPRAIAFYAKAGFVEVGHQTFQLGRDPQCDLVMSKVLGSE